MSLFHSLSPLFFLIPLFSNPILILSSATLDSPNSKSNFFNSHISLYGDAKFINQGSAISLTDSSISSSGLITYQKPLTFLDSNPRNGVSFSADFTFSISPENGDGIMFFIAPRDLELNFHGNFKFGITGTERFFGVEFAGNRVSTDVSSLLSSKTVNVSSIDLVLNSGGKLNSWIDYDATSKRIEVRLSEFGNTRPYDPLLSYEIDLGQMWRDEEVIVSISSSNGNSLQISNVYSCRFVVRYIESTFHSQPLDPSLLKKADQKVKTAEVYKTEGSFFPLSILAGLIFTTGCGAMVAFMVLFLWVVFVDRHRVSSKPEFKYENITIVVGNDIDELKN